MSTILKALKKAEEGMARNTLPGKILSGGSVPGGARARVRSLAMILLSALAIAAVLAHYLQVSRRAETRTDSSALPTAAPAAGRPVPIAGAEGEPGRDALPALHLSGVLWDKSEPLAILNGRPLGVGGEVDGARVVKIGLEAVQVDYRGREYTLSVE
jgi:hypothetical protein